MAKMNAWFVMKSVKRSPESLRYVVMELLMNPVKVAMMGIPKPKPAMALPEAHAKSVMPAVNLERSPPHIVVMESFNLTLKAVMMEALSDLMVVMIFVALKPVAMGFYNRGEMRNVMMETMIP